MIYAQTQLMVKYSALTNARAGLTVRKYLFMTVVNTLSVTIAVTKFNVIEKKLNEILRSYFVGEFYVRQF